MRHTLSLAVLAAVAILVSACAPAAPGSDLTGKTWLLTGVTEQVPAFQGVVPPDQQGRYTITFATDGTFGAQADCNQVNGTYTVETGNAIQIELGASTLAFCPDGDLGVLFTNALASAETYAISGSNLTLSRDDGATLQFTAGTAASPGAAVTPAPAGAVEPTALIGPTWQLTAITEKVPAFQGVVPAEEQAKYTIAFAEDGTFSSTVDCNQLSGSYTAGADGSLSIVPGPMTMAMCPEGSLDGLYLVALGNAASFVVDGETLTITLNDGGTLQFAAA